MCTARLVIVSDAPPCPAPNIMQTRFKEVRVRGSMSSGDRNARSIDRRVALAWLTGATAALAGCGGASDGADPIAVTPVAPTPVPTPNPTPPTPVVRTQANILVTGMSIWRGADLVPANYPDRESFLADNAPAQSFRKALLATPGYTSDLVGYDNQAVGGSFDDQVPGQYAASQQQPHNIVFLGLAMNSGSVYGVYGTGPNAEYAKEVLRGQLRTIKADGGLPLVANTIHPWPEKITPDFMTSSLWLGLNWPNDRRTLFAFEPFTFDAKASTITRREIAGYAGGLFDSPAGGTRIKAGSQLLIGGGASDGRVMIVTERASNQTLRVRPGDIVASETVQATMRHINPPLEEIMDTPPSKQRVTRDWTGGDIPVDGLVSYHLWNSMLLDLCRDEGVALLDIEYRGFKWVERYGWRSVYETTYQGQIMSNLNHPVLKAQQVIYGELLTDLAARYATGSLRSGFQVLRGPPVG